MDSITTEGRCLCGSVRFVVTGKPKMNFVCHCSYCAHYQGTTLGAHCVGYDTKNVRFVDDSDKLLIRYRHPRQPHSSVKFSWGDEDARCSCSKCGSKVGGLWPHEAIFCAQTLLPSEATGSVNSLLPEDLRPRRHAFYASRAIDSDYGDGLRFLGMPGQSDMFDPNAPRVKAPDTGTYSGRCMCGTVKFVASGAPIFSAICHCSYCRHDMGCTMGAHLVAFQAANVQFIDNSDRHLIRYRHPRQPHSTVGIQWGENDARCSCSKCGSKVCNMLSGFIAFAGQTFAETEAVGSTNKGIIPDSLFPTRHIHYANRAFDFHDNLPKFLNMPAPAGDGKLFGESKKQKTEGEEEGARK